MLTEDQIRRKYKFAIKQAFGAAFSIDFSIPPEQIGDAMSNAFANSMDAHFMKQFIDSIDDRFKIIERHTGISTAGVGDEFDI